MFGGGNTTEEVPLLLVLSSFSEEIKFDSWRCAILEYREKQVVDCGRSLRNKNDLLVSMMGLCATAVSLLESCCRDWGFCAVVKDITLRWHQTALHLTLRPLLLLLKNRREFLEKRKVPHRPKFWREHMLVRSMNVAEGLFHQRKAIFAFNHSLICLFNSCNTTVANTCVIGKPILLIQLTCMMRAYLWKCANSSELWSFLSCHSSMSKCQDTWHSVYCGQLRCDM